MYIFDAILGILSLLRKILRYDIIEVNLEEKSAKEHHLLSVQAKHGRASWLCLLLVSRGLSNNTSISVFQGKHGRASSLCISLDSKVLS